MNSTNIINNITNFLSTTFGVVFWFLVLLIPLVIIHEMGHLIMARLCGVKVPEFAIGLPFSRRLFYKKWKGIIWSFYPWLLGGFVRLSGDSDAIDNAHWELSNKNDKKNISQNYTNARREEILQSQELQFFLEENHLIFDQRWQWFEQQSGKAENVKNYETLPNWLIPKSSNLSNTNSSQTTFESKSAKKKTEKNQNLINSNKSEINSNQETEQTTGQIIKSEIKNELTLEQKREIITKEYANLDDQFKTLIDWEFDSRIENKKEYFFAKSWWQQSLIISGGVVFNLITALIVFWIVFVFFGSLPSPYNSDTNLIFPKDIAQMKQESKGKFTIKTTESPQAIFVVPGGVLDKAGVKAKDELIQMGDDNISELSTFEDFRNAVAKYKDKKINFTYKTVQKEFKTVQITPEINKEKQVVIGVVPAYVVSKTATNWPSGVSMAIDEIGQTFKLTFQWFGKAGQALLPQSTDRSALSQTSGPIGVGYIGGEVYKIAGFGGILYLVGAISVSLAIFNMLPIPALDGGRFILLTINKITGKRNKKLEGALIGFTFIFLFGLMILVAFKDLWSIVSPK